jgi:hypothetical protein
MGRLRSIDERCFHTGCGYGAPMSSVQEIQAKIKSLTPAELKQVHDWLEDFLEDQLQFTDGFEAEVQESEREMAGLKTASAAPGRQG